MNEKPKHHRRGVSESLDFNTRNENTKLAWRKALIRKSQERTAENSEFDKQSSLEIRSGKPI